MLGHLDLQTDLQYVPPHLGQKPALTRQRHPVRTSSSDELLRPITHLASIGRHKLASPSRKIPLHIFPHHQCAPSCHRHSASSDQATPVTQSSGQTPALRRVSRVPAPRRRRRITRTKPPTTAAHRAV